MAELPRFRHIHSSGRYTKPAAEMSADIDTFMQECSLITVTEITNDRRAATLGEKGWSYYNHNIGVDSDNCGIAWRLDTWKRTYGTVRRLENTAFDRYDGRHGLYIYACSVVLKRVKTGHKLLVSVSHPPAHVEGTTGFRTDLDRWQGRKLAYLSALDGWQAHVKDLARKRHVDGVLVCADWNLNLKDDWVRNLLHQKWGSAYKIAWRDMPTEGSSLHGGPSAPAGSPGISTHDRIIDGSMYTGLKVIDGPAQMSRIASSDHRPYKETFQFADKAENPAHDDDTAHGDHHPGEEWWGFGDYMTDELYPIPETVTGDPEGELV